MLQRKEKNGERLLGPAGGAKAMPRSGLLRIAATSETSGFCLAFATVFLTRLRQLVAIRAEAGWKPASDWIARGTKVR